MTALPATIRIGPHRYAIVIDTAGCDDADSEGYSVGRRLKIGLRDDRPEPERADTLVHEIVHQVIHRSDAKRMFDDDGTEERFVSQVTPVLLGVLWDNPDLLAYLVSAREETP